MTTLRERLDKELKEAMRAKDEHRLTTIRAIKSAVKYKEVEESATTLDDAGITAVIVALVKQRRDSIAEFKKAGRDDLTVNEQHELDVLLTYLPKQLTSEELVSEVTAAIKSAGAKGPQDMGSVMKLLSGKLKGLVDGQLLSAEVKRQLAAL